MPPLLEETAPSPIRCRSKHKRSLPISPSHVDYLSSTTYLDSGIFLTSSLQVLLRRFQPKHPFRNHHKPSRTNRAPPENHLHPCETTHAACAIKTPRFPENSHGSSSSPTSEQTTSPRHSGTSKARLRPNEHQPSLACRHPW